MNKENYNLNFLFATYCVKILPKFIILFVQAKFELYILTNMVNISNLIKFFKLHTNCIVNMLLDIVVIDSLSKKLRFEIIYVLISLKYNYRLKFKVLLLPTVALPSISNLFLAANWFEREAWDMFGVVFFDHHSLRRIITDYGFVGYPLRKDFPCFGFYEVRFSDSLQKVNYEPIELSLISRFI
jgi:NADH:ubiquinone oxidoreductase subunit C